jgi:hypothetical protein
VDRGRFGTRALQAIGTANNSKLVLMSLEAGGITGSVAGITELVKEVSAGIAH